MEKKKLHNVLHVFTVYVTILNVKPSSKEDKYEGRLLIHLLVHPFIHPPDQQNIYPVHNINKKQISMPHTRFEPTIPGNERLQILDRAPSGIGGKKICREFVPFCKIPHI